MTKRLSAGVLLFAAAMLGFAMTANAERLSPREWSDRSDPYRGLPLFFRASAGTTFVQVNSTGGCDPALATLGGDIHDGTTHTTGQVFCFEGPDSLWPANFGTAGQKTWKHWSRNKPPVPLGSKWHITTMEPNSGSVFTSWCGCDSLGTNPACADVTFWVNKKGYGTEWEYSQILDVSNLGAASGGRLKFDLRYDTECVYDYLYLEYFDTTANAWKVMLDSLGTAGVFNGVSGNTAATNNCDGGGGGATDGNYYNTGTVNGTTVFYGNSTWYTNVTFPVPTKTNLKFRWRGFSDPGLSDEDGRADTDGLAAIDNVRVTFNNGTVVNDNFEFGDYVHVTTTNGGGNVASWAFQQGGNTYDGWHLTFDPMYKNKGNTCTFSNDWMWAAKPDAGLIPENAFEFFLTSPVIPCDGWSGGTCLYSDYLCMEDLKNDYTNPQVRFYDTSKTKWSPWQDFDGFITFAGCEFWNINDSQDLTPFLGTTIDSLQMGWEVLDPDDAADFSWGKHANSQFVMDKVAFGSFDGTASVFVARGIDLFADTFSRADPAHTPFLQNAEQGIWNGLTGGTRAFADADSLNVSITDFNGLTSQDVDIFWRVDQGHGTAFGSWNTKAVHFSLQDATRPAGEGTYRIIIGKDDGGVEDQAPPAGNKLIWKAGQTCEYYITCNDDAVTPLAYFPGTADPATAGGPTYFEFSILPFDIATSGTVATSHDGNGRPVPIGPAGTHFVLLVDDYGRNALDFQNSTGFNATGGIGQGTFTGAVFDQPEDMTERALAMLYGGSEAVPHWDKYDVLGAGSSVQCEPRGVSDVAGGLGAYMTDNPLIIYYDALIWLQGTFDGYSYADTTRLELANYIERGGCLFSTGDQIAFHLGTGGNNADSLIGFGVEYLGFAFTNTTDETVTDRVLNFLGEPLTSMAGLELGIYGECPIRTTPDRMFLSVPGGDGVPKVLGRYSDSSSGLDNNRICFTKCDQPGAGGTAAHLAFGIENLLNDTSRARLLGRFLGTDCGLTVATVNGPNNGVDAPVIANGFGFSLAEARPNPFSDATAIQFSVPANTHVMIEVYNILGQKVRTLVNENMEANSYVRDWDGRSDAGAEVSSGIYFYKMVAGEFSATKKAVLLK